MDAGDEQGAAVKSEWPPFGVPCDTRVIGYLTCLGSPFRKSVYGYFPGAVTGALCHHTLNRTCCGLSLRPSHVTKEECLGERRSRGQ